MCSTMSTTDFDHDLQRGRIQTQSFVLVLVQVVVVVVIWAEEDDQATVWSCDLTAEQIWLTNTERNN